MTYSKADLDRLLRLRNEQPEATDAIDAQIYQQFLQTHAVLVLDMAGFSRLTIRYSIIHFLAMVQRLASIAIPVIEQHQGQTVKREADNLFAIFDSVTDAIDCAIAIQARLAAVNVHLPDAQDLHAGIGIGYGDVLRVGDNDLYGSEMNLACKLGEDLARSGEILLTEAAYRQVQHEGRQWEPLTVSISGLDLITYKLQVG
ncbi:adenylate/guanylate cyclase domain-containing protein [Microcoleus sp. FACHB-1515]|uniref:adenylate/guanylate cyclase domain-containing protein n=1 Tax=Cyanophyceae TaxID=3028117 RepID=UPI00168974BB|nr:adenylate/guanylate cyclase domain-containing protein [Microcoleus sp. FACHB-1515]MBD2091413.1 adenylate/guanylate cyclase domain-containing protein [Microcoleus sp. FACHB-1515]